MAGRVIAGRESARRLRLNVVVLGGFLAAFAALGSGVSRAADKPAPTVDGYRGIWFGSGHAGPEHRYLVSGGLATFPHNNGPIAIHSPDANKTFFCFGGASPAKTEVLHLLAYMDHGTGKVSRPRIVHERPAIDAHENPAMAIDDEGFLWIFSSMTSRARPAYIHRSRQPHSIDSFERVQLDAFAHAQPWAMEGRGLFLFFSRFVSGQRLFWKTSADGRRWSNPSLAAGMDRGHDQVSAKFAEKLGTAFCLYPRRGGEAARTNVYYIETLDFGENWQTAGGEPVPLPVGNIVGPALVRDYAAKGLLVFLKDLAFDAEGRPVLLFLTSRGEAPGPENGPRVWRVARWTGEDWDLADVCESDHNFDSGSIHVDGDEWRIFAPTDPGPYPFRAGGEVVVWSSVDRGRTWKRLRAVTAGSKRNHGYVRRPVHAHPDFAAIWADGDPTGPSESSLYIADRLGERPRRLPAGMDGESADPEPLASPAE